MLGHLKFLLESERGEDLSLRRFSPLDYSMKLSGPVECPFEGCGFQTDLGKTMISHQQEVRHPGWNRHDTTREANLSLGIAVWGHARRLSQRGTGATNTCSPTTSLWHVLFAKVTGQTGCQGLENTLKTCMAKKTQEAATSRGRVEVNSSQNKGKYSHPLSLEATNSSTQNFRQHVPSS